MITSKRASIIKDILWIVAIAGAVAMALRLARGLGYTTGLNDSSAWGLWIAFKLTFVALAGGGFTLAAMVYIFHLEIYRPLLRRAILIALLGYGCFLVSLLFDLGLPWHIYAPIVVNWQHHSVMFEIAWCVMLYFAVLNLEFGPIILEHRWFRRPIFQRLSNGLHRLTIPIVIAGIALSTLHQSSLGALFLIMPFRVHPLWYSPSIPVLFFASAIGAGLMALILESGAAAWLSGRQLKRDLLARLGLIGGVMMWVYLTLRIGDLFARGVLPAALDGSWQSRWFVVEVVIGGVLPAALLLWRRVRRSLAGLMTSALLAVAGIASQRMSLSLFTMWRPEGASYIPSGVEILIAFAIPAMAGLIYLTFTEHLAVFDDQLPDRRRSPCAPPQFERASLIYRDDSLRGAVARRSGIGVVVVAATIAALPASVVTGQLQPPTPVLAARGWEVLTLVGVRADHAVYFDHADHQSRLSEKFPLAHEACRVCHHLSTPDDGPTRCSDCHRDMYLPTSIFDHALHQTTLGGNAACAECHAGEHTRATARPCAACHEQMTPAADASAFNDFAPGYKDALHGRCLSCHTDEAAAQKRPDLAVCATCHRYPTASPSVIVSQR